MIGTEKWGTWTLVNILFAFFRFFSFLFFKLGRNENPGLVPSIHVEKPELVAVHAGHCTLGKGGQEDPCHLPSAGLAKVMSLRKNREILYQN